MRYVIAADDKGNRYRVTEAEAKRRGLKVLYRLAVSEIRKKG